jgi:hypothetical protein
VTAGKQGPHPGIAAIVLAAGEGRRLRPLTASVPKALCPVGNVPLLERALARLAALGFLGPDRVAVNTCHLGEQIVDWLGGSGPAARVHLSIEQGSPLGTAGGVGRMREWIGGRGALVGNADAYLASPGIVPGPDIAALLEGWDGTSVRILGVPADQGSVGEFGAWRFAGFSLLPWSDVARLAAEPGNLVRTTWRPAEREGRLEVVPYPGRYLDTGTPGDYLAANLHAAGATRSGRLIDPTAVIAADVHHSVIGAGALVRGPVLRSVVLPGGRVDAAERLVDSIRAGADTTMVARAGAVPA